MVKSKQKQKTESKIAEEEISEDTCSHCHCKGGATPKQQTLGEGVKLTPYREIILSDGAEFFIKTTCNLTSDERIQIQQYREREDLEGRKFECSEPSYFESKDEFLDWLLISIKNNFDKIPFITIKPLKTEEIKKHERETTDTMYM